MERYIYLCIQQKGLVLPSYAVYVFVLSLCEQV